MIAPHLEEMSKTMDDVVFLKVQSSDISVVLTTCLFKYIVVNETFG